MAEMEREELEHWLEEVQKWWFHDEPPVREVQLELPFPPAQPEQEKALGVEHDIAE